MNWLLVIIMFGGDIKQARFATHETCLEVLKLNRPIKKIHIDTGRGIFGGSECPNTNRVTYSWSCKMGARCEPVCPSIDHAEIKFSACYKDSATSEANQ